MAIIRYVEIENFKLFGEKVHIDLGHPAVLIGPNNSGKTSVIQAITLWSQGVKTWYEKKGEASSTKDRTRYGAGINRLTILDVPVSETRFFWSGTKVRKGSLPIEIAITVGLERNGIVKPCRFIFTYRDSEVIYAKPDADTLKDDELLRYASRLNVNLLYPISAILSGASTDVEEPSLPDGRINVLLGQGQTAHVLRNICYKIAMERGREGEEDWDKITNIMERLFMVSLEKPQMNAARGSFTLAYRQKDVDYPLEISLAGRGMQQVLLILAYLYWHKNSVILVDEPDAHLEILRQKQIYRILNTKAEENSSQVIIATHSEAILEDAAETNLSLLLLYGKVVNLSENQQVRNQARNVLQLYGMEHYYKARINPRILMMEGSTDKEMITELAKHLGHRKAQEILEGNLNIYYTKDIYPERTFERDIDRVSGAFQNARNYFYALESLVPELKALGIFDRDNQNKQDDMRNNFAIVYWKNYEIENYFITPKVLADYASHRFNERKDEDLFTYSFSDSDSDSGLFRKTIDETLLERKFGGNKDAMAEYYKASIEIQRMILSDFKMSEFAEEVFRRYAEKTSQPMLLTKGELYRLVPFCKAHEIPQEVTEKLDLIAQYLEYQNA
jgi:ABC-type cobalamin/Fe3+-siderophores transport system ATPase subunit